MDKKINEVNLEKQKKDVKYKLILKTMLILKA